MNSKLFLMLIFTHVFVVVWAQNSSNDSIVNPFVILSKQGHSGGGTIRFHHDARIESIVQENIPATRMLSSEGGTSRPTHGFRVQVFSSNRQRVAKDEAFQLETLLLEAFPNVGVYVSYTSPFWRVRMGDFQTQEEARIFSEQLLNRFPRLKGSTYTVRERIRR